MATGPQAPASEDERAKRAREKSRLRKQRFDARMRNLEGEGDTSPRRGCVFFLSDEARAILKRNRERRRDLDLPPVLDSRLVESLLRAYAQQGEQEQPEGPLVVDETLAQPDVVKVLAKKKAVEETLKSVRGALFAAEGTIEQLEGEAKFRPTNWEAIERRLLEAQRFIGPGWSRQFAKRLCLDTDGAASEAHLVQVVEKALADHIAMLIDWVARRE